MSKEDLTRKLENLKLESIKTPNHKALLRRALIQSGKLPKISFWQKVKNSMTLRTIIPAGTIAALTLAFFLNGSGNNPAAPYTPTLPNLSPKQVEAKELAQKILNQPSLSEEQRQLLQSAVQSNDLAFAGEMKNQDGEIYQRVVFKDNSGKELYFAANEENKLISAGENTVWKTYQNQQFNFEIQYPSDFRIEEKVIVDEFNNIPLIVRFYNDKDNDGQWDNGFVPFDISDPVEIKRIESTREYAFSIEVTPDETRTYLNRNESIKSSVVINGEEMETYFLRAPVPAVSIIEERNNFYYTLTAISKTEFDDSDKSILSSFKFSN